MRTFWNEIVDHALKNKCSNFSYIFVLSLVYIIFRWRLPLRAQIVRSRIQAGPWPWASGGPKLSMDFEIRHFLIKCSAKKILSGFRVGKTTFRHFWPPCKNVFGYPWKIHYWPLTGKTPSDAHVHGCLGCVRSHCCERLSKVVGTFSPRIYSITTYNFSCFV